jgi:LacI family transcriptional regulator
MTGFGRLAVAVSRRFEAGCGPPEAFMLATIRDVAREAGVSIATVSRVFNGSRSVSEEARRRVQEAATALGYWPNRAARSLTTNQSHALGVLLPDLYGEFFSEVIRGIDYAASREHFQILISVSHADTDTLLTAARAMQGRTDGLIVMAPEEASAGAMDQIQRRFPLVLLNPRFEVEGCSSVSINNREGAFAAVNHLLRIGHRRVAIIKGPAGNVDAEERFLGYRQALHDAGLEPEPVLELPGDFTESSGYRGAMEILRQHPRPSAVFAANDYMALGFLSALADTGIHAPKDIAVVGFDDIEISRYLNPPLTTVHVDAQELGARAVRLLISQTRAPSIATPKHEVLAATLVVRNSCGCVDAEKGAREGGRAARSVGRDRSRRTGERSAASKKRKRNSFTQEEAQP